MAFGRFLLISYLDVLDTTANGLGTPFATCIALLWSTPECSCSGPPWHTACLWRRRMWGRQNELPVDERRIGPLPVTSLPAANNLWHFIDRHHRSNTSTAVLCCLEVSTYTPGCMLALVSNLYPAILTLVSESGSSYKPVLQQGVYFS